MSDLTEVLSFTFIQKISFLRQKLGTQKGFMIKHKANFGGFFQSISFQARKYFLNGKDDHLNMYGA